MADEPNTSEQQCDVESTPNSDDNSESDEEEMSDEELRDAIVDIYKGTIKEESVESKYGLSSGSLIREALARLLHIQSSRVLNLRPPLKENTDYRQIYRWATHYANAKMPTRAYTHTELREAVFRRITNVSFYPPLTAKYTFPYKRSIRVKIRMKDAAPSYDNLFIEYGIPMRSLRRFVNKVIENFGAESLKQLKKQNIPHNRIREMIKQTDIGNVGRPTFLTEEEAAKYVAAAEKEQVYGEPIANDCVSKRLMECLQNVRAEKNAKANYESQLTYARKMIKKVNKREGRSTASLSPSSKGGNERQYQKQQSDEDDDDDDDD